MTIFAKKTMNVREWARVQDQIGELQMILGAPYDLMMLSADTRDPTLQDIYIGLPDVRLLAAFSGFRQVDRSVLPDFLSTLVVREDGFEQSFPDIFRKRRSRISDRP